METTSTPIPEQVPVAEPIPEPVAVAPAMEEINVINNAQSALNEYFNVEKREHESKEAIDRKIEDLRTKLDEEDRALEKVKCLSSPEFKKALWDSSEMKDAKMTANGIIFAFIIVGAIMAALVLFAFAKFQDNLPSYVSIPCAIAAAFIAFRVGQSWSWGPIKNAKDNVVATLCTRL